MKLGNISDPFSGEKLAEIYPRLAPFIDPERTPHLARLHYFPGRHLTDIALGREQAIRVQRLALRGRAVTAGVVQGLELTWRTLAGGVQFQLRPGHALTSAGHDLVVDRTVEFAYEELKYFDPVLGQLDELPLGLMEDAPISAWAGVLVLQPGFVDDADLPQGAQDGHGTDFTPCPRVPEDEVYYKTTSTDASRLILYPIPWDEPSGPLWQSRVAWSIFNREAAGEAMPWLDLGVPLAVIGFNDALVPEWIDRHAVVRPAGKPRQRVLIQPTFDARVWPARFEHFCDQLSHLSAPLAAAEICEFLPPVGLLPRAYLELKKTAAWQATQRFFPKGYTVDLAVIPLEQLDALIADSVRLQPYDLAHLDAVRLLLPVSQRWFDPDLLKIEVIDRKFNDHIQAYRTARGDWLARRYDLAQRRYTLELSLGLTPTTYPRSAADEDPKRLESPEDPLSVPPDPAEQFRVLRSGSATAPHYESLLLTDLQAAGRAFRKSFTEEDKAEFKELFAACGLTREQTRLAFASQAPGWLRDFEVTKAADSTLSNEECDELRRELLAYIKKQTEVQEAEDAALKSSNIKELLDYFDRRADEADELVDAGFLKVRTDVFRLGTLLSNSSLATKFVASPTLANVVDRKPPKTDTAGVNHFASQLLANFAPSAVGANASTAVLQKSSTVAGTGASAGANVMRSNVALFSSHDTSSKVLKVDPNLMVNALEKSGARIEADQSTYSAIADKLEGVELEAFQTLRSTAEGLTSKQVVGQFEGVAQLGKFADTYVANFNDLSQKQIRAIPLDRLQPALAPTVRREIHDGRLEIFERLTRLGISLGDLTTDFVDVPGKALRPPKITADLKITRLRFQTLISRRHFDTLIQLREETATTTQEINDADESKHFSTGVAYADMAMAALRAVETRIKEYRAFVERCREALKQTQGLIQAITTALTPIELELEEARQDVAVALALRDEEQARLDRINAHREKVLREHVDFLVFHRPRAVRLNTDVPSRVIEPALTAEPVIECLRENPTPPADLAALRDIFRASPARWFKHAPKWIGQVDRWEHLRALIERATKTAILAPETPAISSGRYHQTLNRVYQARQTAARKFIAATSPVNLAGLASLSWRDLRDQASRQLTLGQLIGSGPAPLAKAAAEELENIFAVTTCLHENFSRVPGLIRLQWAEKFGQFDTIVVGFRDLSRLPGWRQIDFTLRREMQLHADWIFGRVDTDVADALDLMNDLVRVALLLASHAPVDQLIVGHPLETEVTPRPGLLINLKVDPLRIRRGMEVTYKISDTQILRAVVDDISASHVAARVVDVPTLTGGTLKLTPSSTFYFR
jgi:hypothetical protein